MLELVYENKGYIGPIFALVLFMILFDVWSNWDSSNQMKKCKHDQFKKIGESTIYDINLNKSHTTTLKCLSCGKIVEVENANSNK